MTDTDLLVKVIQTLATADGVAPAEIDYNLSEHIDPETLIRLEDMDQGPWSFTFRVSDHQVTITDESTVLVDGMSHSTSLEKR